MPGSWSEFVDLLRNNPLLIEAIVVVLLFVVVLIVVDQVGDVEEAGLLRTDVHEGGLDAGDDRIDPAQIDVPDEPVLIGPVEEDLHQLFVLEERHPGFPGGGAHQNFTSQRV